MILMFSPVRMDTPLTVEVEGDMLVLNGEAYDFAPVPEGAILPRAAVDCDWLASDVTRRGGVLELTLILPHGAHAPQDTLYPAALRVTKAGVVDLPLYETEEPVDGED